MRILGPWTRSRWMNLTMAMELELQEERGGWDGSRAWGLKGVAGSGFATRFSPNNSINSNGMGKGHGADCVYVWGSKEASNEPGPNLDSNKEKRRMTSKDRGVQHLSYQELLDRNQKELGYKCGEQFQLDHLYPNRHLRGMLMDTIEEGKMEVDVLVVTGVGDEVEIEWESRIMCLSGMISKKEWKPQGNVWIF